MCQGLRRHRKVSAKSTRLMPWGREVLTAIGVEVWDTSLQNVRHPSQKKAPRASTVRAAKVEARATTAKTVRQTKEAQAKEAKENGKEAKDNGMAFVHIAANEDTDRDTV